MDIAIDITFEPNDAFRATVQRAAEPLVLAPFSAPSTMPPPSMRATEPVASAAPARRTKLWPLALCGFVAVTCGTIAFLKSPLGAHPKVAPYAAMVLAQVDRI